MKWNESGFRPLLCTYRLNWARRTSWGWWDDWDDTVLQTQDSKFEPWRSEAEHATSRSRRLPTILTFTRGWGRNNIASFKPPRPGTEPRTLAWKAAVLTTTLGPPPYSTLGWRSCSKGHSVLALNWSEKHVNNPPCLTISHLCHHMYIIYFSSTDCNVLTYYKKLKRPLRLKNDINHSFITTCSTTTPKRYLQMEILSHNFLFYLLFCVAVYVWTVARTLG